MPGWFFLFGEGDLLALAGEEEVFEFPIGEEGFDFGGEDEAVVVIEREHFRDAMKMVFRNVTLCLSWVYSPLFCPFYH
jgi:hypothetical protein